MTPMNQPPFGAVDKVRRIEHVPQKGGAEGLDEYWQMIRRRKGTLVFTALLGAIAGLLFTLPQTPIYEAYTALEVLDASQGIMPFKDAGGNASDAFIAPTNLNTQVSILESNTLRDRVMAKVMARKDLAIQPPKDKYGELRRLFNLPGAKEKTVGDAVDEAAAGVMVRALPTNRIIDLRCESANPQLAALYINTLATEFIEERLQSHWETTQHASEWMTRQLQELKIKLEKSESELQNYASSMGLQFTGEKETESVAGQKLRQLQVEASTAQGDRVAKQAKYELALKAPAESLPEVLDDDSLRNNRHNLTDLRRQLAELNASFTPEHPRMKKVEAQIAAIETESGKTRGRILERIHNDLIAAQTRERLLLQELTLQSALVTDQSSKAVHYNILKGEVDSTRQLYDSLLQRVKEAGVTSTMRSSNFRIIDPAVPPGAPIRPSLRRGMMIGLFIGLFGGIGLILIRENRDRSITLPGETQRYLNAPELGVIPAEAMDGARRLFPGRLRQAKDKAIERASFSRASSMMAESFRVALTSMLLSDRKGSPRVIAISSAGPMEGKTTVACNLAISYAEINWRVLLVDGDMRRPRLHTIFGVPNDEGLATLLTASDGVEKLESLAVGTDIPNLFVLPRGALKTTPVNMLHSARFADVIAEARKSFDVVLIDTPPMLHLSDGRAIAHGSDGVIFVVRSGRTTRESIIAARERFALDQIKVLGSVLNDWNPRVYGYQGYENYKDYRAYYEHREPAGRIDST